MLKMRKEETDALEALLKNSFTFKGKDGKEYATLDEVMKADELYDKEKQKQKEETRK